MRASIIRLLVIPSCILLCTLLFQNKIFAQCTASGPRSGTTFSDDGSIGSYAFSSPANAATSDATQAIASAIIFVLSGNTHYLKATGFGFSIPATATICGILVEVEKSATNISILAWVTDNSVRLLKNGTLTGNNYATAAKWPTSESYYSYGGAADTWGLGTSGWSASDINAANFGVVFSSSINGIIGLLPSARINHIRITVNYFDGVPLPLSLTNFSAIALDDHSAKLAWTTTNNDEAVTFGIQRSSNSIDWTAIYSEHDDATSHDKTYQYRDMTNHDKTAYYRLQIQQASGRTSYSSIEKVNWQTSSFTIYPNPATTRLYVDQKEQVQSLQCVGTDGRNWPVTYLQTANNLYQVDVGKLPRGTYILCINEKRKLFLLE